MKQAERYQNRLYNLFPYVRLISFPLMGESGPYTWEVSM